MWTTVRGREQRVLRAARGSSPGTPHHSGIKTRGWARGPRRRLTVAGCQGRSLPAAASPDASPSFQLASTFQGTARMGSETEAHFTAVERTLQYMKVGRRPGVGAGALEASVLSLGLSFRGLCKPSFPGTQGATRPRALPPHPPRPAAISPKLPWAPWLMVTGLLCAAIPACRRNNLPFVAVRFAQAFCYTMTGISVTTVASIYVTVLSTRTSEPEHLGSGLCVAP